MFLEKLVFFLIALQLHFLFPLVVGAIDCKSWGYQSTLLIGGASQLDGESSCVF